MNASLAEIQQAQLDILLKCRDVCEKHHIPYFLAQGTLLGAVRHGGFIPWDDDIDIIMPSWAIKKFVPLFQAEMDENYLIQSIDTEELCPQPWIKIKKKNTASMPKQYAAMPIHWGIGMDIFPVYEVGDSKAAHLIAKLRFKAAKKLLAAHYTPYQQNVSLVNRLIATIPRVLRRSVVKWCMSGLEKDRKPGRDVFTICKNSKFLSRSWLYGEETYLEFEKERFRVPSDSDAFLTKMFGDYMTPPPLDQQRGHDLKLGDIIWDTKRDYTYYQKKADC